MPIYTFSTRPKRPADTAAVEAAKKYCDDRGLNFSAFVVSLIKERQTNEPKA